MWPLQEIDIVTTLKSENKIHLIVAGGCQVVGYPFDSTNSFSERIRCRLLTACGCIDLTCVPHVKLTDSAKVLRAVCDETRRNHIKVIVLQLGNYEFTAYLRRMLPFESFFRSVKGLLRRDKTGGQKQVSEEIAAADRPRSPSWNFFVLKSYLKLPIYLMRRGLSGKDSMYAAQFREFVETMPKDCTVVLLLPLPCLDVSTFRFRKRGAMMFKENLNNLNAIVYDPYVPYGNGERLSDLRYYFDSIHINVAGHGKLGDDIAEIILREIRSRLCDASAK